MKAEIIGNFIKELREDKKLTQEELAELVPISRQAVSRWERGKSLPNHDVLLKLSEIFSVTIDELLAGTRKANSVSLELYKERNKFVKITKITLIIIFLLILLLLSYYFFNQYNSVKIYNVSGNTDTFKINDGLFIRTNEKIFFELDNIKFKKDVEYEYIEIYYLEDDKENLILKRYDSDLVIQDSYGYEEYFDYDKLDIIINNMYLSVCTSEACDEVKLYFREDYKNNNFFRRKKDDVSDSENKPLNLSLDSEEIVEKIKEKFTQQGENYFYEIKKKNIVETFYYMDDPKIIFYEIIEGKKVREVWCYNLLTNLLDYNNYFDNVFFSYRNEINCEKGNCENYLNKVPTFYDKLNNSLY